MVKLVVIFGFLVAFAAGFVVATSTKAPPAEAGSPKEVPATHPMGPPRGGILPAALNLTPEQQEKMREIWKPRDRENDPRRQARDERDAALMALLTPEQKTKYDEIQKNFQDRLSAIDKQFKDEFTDKVNRTREILTPEQRIKYDEFISRHQPPFEHGPRDRGDHGDHGDRALRESNRRGDDRATSQPRSQP